MASITDFVPLRAIGTGKVGTCPFCNKPDLFVYWERNREWTCLGCQHQINSEGIFFYLKTGETHGIYYEVLEQAREWFSTILLRSPQAQIARDFLRDREIGSEVAIQWGLGYAPDGYIDHLNSVDQDMLVYLGLLAKGQRGTYERFRNRLMIPVYDDYGRTIGFAGRTLLKPIPDTLAKFVNSPASYIFQKGDHLYGLDCDAIQKAGCVCIVEGYFDVITPHKFGVTNVVAQMGTALTDRQCDILMGLGVPLYIVLDGDEAGGKAMMRDSEKLRVAQIVRLPDGYDPDLFIRTYGIDAWLKLFDNG